MAATDSVSILSLSQNRPVVKTIHEYIQPHGCAVGGILESDPFSADDVALALGVLEPRPKAVVVRRGYSEDERSRVRDVYADYAQEVGINVGTVIKITDTMFDDVGKEGVPKWVLHQLQD